MSHTQLWFESTRKPGTRLALHWWKSENSGFPSRGYVWIVHGMGEHGARYGEFATFLTGLGFDVLAPDLPGHGLSRAEGGYRLIPEISEMCEELQEMLRFWFTAGPVAKSLSQNPGAFVARSSDTAYSSSLASRPRGFGIGSKRGLSSTPWYLVGHSMGALISLQWILRGKRGEAEPEFAQRAFLSAPPLKLKMPVPAWKNALARGLLKLAPDFKIPNGIPVDGLSYDAANIAAYRTDPLVHDEATPRIYLSILSSAEEVLARAADIEIPVCLAVGADDPIVDPAQIRSYYESLGTHKKFIEFPNNKHEILNEIGRRRCFEAAAGWFL